MDRAAIDDYAENVLAPRISMINGVPQVNVFGAQKYALHVQVDPNKLKAQGIGLNDADQARQSWNATVPTPQISGRDSTYTINTNGLLQSPGGLLRSSEA